MDLISLEERMLQSVDTIDLKEIHTFSEGTYVRELYIPKGTLILGKRHRKPIINMLIKGHMTIYDEDSTYEVKAPFIASAEAFTKKAGLAHEDSIWVNVHPTYLTNLEDIEDEFIIPEEEYNTLLEQTKQEILEGGQ